ncbi:MAG: hypothetical protein IJA69_03745 [Clostridia bacterium]|nr:hypothetical protein [Clostridia bacterium]
MTQQLYDTLYNKTIEDVTKEDLNLYNRLVGLSSCNKDAPLTAAVTLPMMFVLGNLILPGSIGIVSAITFGAGIPLFSFFYLSDLLSARSVLKENIGISPKEFRQFKKSGGIKRIKKILKEYKKNPYKASKIHPLPGGLTVEDYEANSKKQAQIVEQLQSQNDKQAQTSYIGDQYNQETDNIEQEK